MDDEQPAKKKIEKQIIKIFWEKLNEVTKGQADQAIPFVTRACINAALIQILDKAYIVRKKRTKRG